MSKNTYGMSSAIHYLSSIAVITVFIFTIFFPLQAIALNTTGQSVRKTDVSELVLVLAQASCTQFVGEYASHDHAIRVKNELLRKRFNAWIEHHGSYLSGTRTYVVYAAVPC